LFKEYGLSKSWNKKEISLTGDSKMFDTMKNNADFWTICLSHTLGCAVNGVKAKAGFFGIEKSKFDGPDEFVKEARRHRKLPKSATKGKNLFKFFCQ
jgi:hypothetical protein